MPRNFGFMIDGFLAGLDCPGRYADLADDLNFLRLQGVTTLVSLTEAPLPADELREAGLRYHHLPIQDFHAPTQAQLKIWSKLLTSARAAREVVAVHCGAGMGRTGTLLAAALVQLENLTASEAIAKVRMLRPGSVETPEQEDSVIRFEQGMRPS